MTRTWTFGQKIGAGFAMTVTLSSAISVIAIFQLRSVVLSKDRVIAVNAQNLIDARQLETIREGKSAAARAFLLTQDERHLDSLREATQEFDDGIERLNRTVYTEEGRRLLHAIEQADADHQQAIDRVIALRRTAADIEQVAHAFDDQVMPKREQVAGLVRSFVSIEQRLLDDAKSKSTRAAFSAIAMVIIISVVIVLVASLLATLLTRVLARQIGAAVGQVQSSSTELQAAANQQAVGAKQQTTAMSEITTTIRELLATSRQIAESAQRVAHIAGETTGSALSGAETVNKTQEVIAGIRRQVDLIVHHMLDLGKKSQHIGAVVEIVSELAEQTNILAINATIEAAGAGEAGRRFAIVADEIRKLADRVTGSTKEIRSLIEDVRSAVNTTVMATESGSKVVDSGSRQFGEVASTFKQIAGLVSTTTEAAREIELSTKQQTTAVEQVNVAISNVAQATKEGEISCSQTLQTASQLATLSRDLIGLIRPHVSSRA